jgi:hypothetical protein
VPGPPSVPVPESGPPPPPLSGVLPESGVVPPSGCGSEVFPQLHAPAPRASALAKITNGKFL